MNDKERELVESLHRAAQEQLNVHSLETQELPDIHHSELPAGDAASPLCREWNTYRREAGRLLAEGHEGKFILVHGETILGLFDTWDAAREAGLERFLLQPFLVHQI